jgi:hypothetical protein
MGLSDFPKKFIPPRKRYSAVVPSPSSSSSPPTSAEKKPAPNSDDQSPLGVRQLEDHITSRTQCDDNESLLIRTNLNSNRQNQTLGTIPEACKVFYSDEFNKTATSSSSLSSLKLVVRYRNNHHSYIIDYHNSNCLIVDVNCDFFCFAGSWN